MNALLSVFAMIYTAISLYACQAAPQRPVDAPVSDVPIEQESDIVNILQSRADISQSLQQAIDLYTAANPGAHINVATVSGASEYRVALRTRLLAGSRADVFHVFSGQEARELAPHLEDLSALAWIKSAAGQTADPVSFDGGIYGIPYGLEYCGLLANRNIFEVADIPLSAIVTWADLEESLSSLANLLREDTLAEDFPALRTVTDFPVQDKHYLGQFAANVVLTGEFDAPSDALTVRELRLPHGRDAEEFFRLLVRCSPKGDWTEREGLSYQAQLEDFAAGKTAVQLCDRAGAERILALNPELEGRLALLPITLPGLDTSVIYTGSPLWWAVGSASTEPAKASAKQFLTWLYQSDSGSAIVAARFGAVSPWLDAGKETGRSLDRQMLSLLERDRTAPQVWREFPYEWGTDSFTAAFRAWYAGETEWTDMLQTLREEWAYAG